MALPLSFNLRSVSVYLFVDKKFQLCRKHGESLQSRRQVESRSNYLHVELQTKHESKQIIIICLDKFGLEPETAESEWDQTTIINLLYTVQFIGLPKNTDLSTMSPMKNGRSASASGPSVAARNLLVLYLEIPQVLSPKRRHA